jgi:serine protease AprX
MNTRTIVHKIVSGVLILAFTLALCVVPGVSPASAGTPAADIAYDSVIVQGKDTQQVVQLVLRHGGVITSRLDIIHGVGALVPTGEKAVLASEPGIVRITSNHTVGASGVHASPTQTDQTSGPANGSTIGSAIAPAINSVSNRPTSDYPDAIGADLAWAKGDTGWGVTVAVIDTGISDQIDGLSQGINGQSNRIIGWVDFVDSKSKKPQDPNGHGSHIAGIIANTELGADNEWNGVAPGVNLVGVRVLDENGYGTYEKVIQGIQWVDQNKARYGIRVVNLSIEASVQSPYWADPLNQAIMQAWADGLVVVVTAGNGGPSPMSITVPGNNPYAITVGAFTDAYTPANWGDDYIASFSSAGPTLDGFVKPDVMAPGAHMVSTMMPNTKLARQYPDNHVADYYFSMAGTSQAAAVVSGVAALVIAHNHNLTPNQVKYRLMVTALPWKKPTNDQALYSIWQQGTGRVNALDAALADVSGSANPGMDVVADLAGTTHYEGYSYYDDTAKLFLLKGPYNNMTDTFGSWSGTFGSWSGTFGSWSGTFGAWSGTFGAWSGTFGAWSGTFGLWSGTFGAWSGGYGSWAGTFGAWSGSVPWINTSYADPAFVASFMAGDSPNPKTSAASVGSWIKEP